MSKGCSITGVEATGIKLGGFSKASCPCVSHSSFGGNDEPSPPHHT
jgi:hypothetical protein